MSIFLKTLLLFFSFLWLQTHISQAQISGTCNNKYFFNLYTDTINQPFPNEMAATTDAGIITVGFTRKMETADVMDGFISKIDKEGKIVWSKLLDGPGNDRLYSITKLSDNNFVTFGTVSGIDNYFFIIKFDDSGNVIWQKQYFVENSGEIPGNGHIKEDRDGSLIVVTNFVENGLSFSNRILFLKASSSGDLLMSKFYTPSGLSLAGTKDFLLKDGYAYIGGSTYEDAGRRGLLIKVQNTTGDIKWTKSYDLNNATLEFRQVFDFSENTICITGEALNPMVNAIYIIDTAGVCISSKYFQLTNGLQGAGGAAAMTANKQLFWSCTNGLVSDAAPFTLFNIDPQIGILKSYNFENIINTTVNGALTNIEGDIIITGFNQYQIDDYHMFFGKFSPTREPECAINDSTFIFRSATQKSKDLFWLTKGKSYTSFKPLHRIEPAGPLLIDSLCSNIERCDTIKLQVRQQACSISDTVVLVVLRNVGCNSTVKWVFDKFPVHSIDQPNDSTIKIVYKQGWQGYIYAEIQTSCKVIRDSVYISLLNATQTFSLGSDTTICPGSMVVLNATNNYINYKWQDGSQDSIFIVTRPGQYWVQVQDACNRVYSDTILFSSPGSLLFDLDSVNSKCKNDTIEITAPPGFINYKWSPDYKIIDRNSPTALLFSPIDTIYFIQAEKGGCTVMDSIKISINKTAVIDLGADTSLCLKDSITLDAGATFTDYMWSNGSKDRQIKASSKGLYFVTAKDLNGCVAKDSLEIINQYAKPIIGLPKNLAICNNQNFLDAGGGFITYKWNTGESSRGIIVNTIGTYWIHVSDNNNCHTTDTIFISAINKAPANFLPADTAICYYSNIFIEPISKYKNYRWNNGSASSRIQTNAAGKYWLKVLDINNCSGTDTIIVNMKQCFEGFNIPSAFTPNNDGLNDVFRPLIGGNVTSYHFMIYNRFGQRVFESKELLHGWDGTYYGKKQDTNTFVWQCEYQLGNKEIVLKKGTVILVN